MVFKIKVKLDLQERQLVLDLMRYGELSDNTMMFYCPHPRRLIKQLSKAKIVEVIRDPQAELLVR